MHIFYKCVQFNRHSCQKEDFQIYSSKRIYKKNLKIQQNRWNHIIRQNLGKSIFKLIIDLLKQIFLSLTKTLFFFNIKNILLIVTTKRKNKDKSILERLINTTRQYKKAIQQYKIPENKATTLTSNFQKQNQKNSNKQIRASQQQAKQSSPTTEKQETASNKPTQNEQYIFSSNELQLLEKNGWLDVKEKAERLVIAYEQKYMVVIERTVDLLDLMIDATLQAFTSQQISFFIDEILFTVIKNIIEHKEYQHEENYLIAEKIIMKTLYLINQSVDLDIPKLAEILSYIFNPSRSFYSKTILLRAPQQSDYPVTFFIFKSYYSDQS